MKEIKEDGQQNNWAIEDDVDKISVILKEILEVVVCCGRINYSWLNHMCWIVVVISEPFLNNRKKKV